MRCRVLYSYSTKPPHLSMYPVIPHPSQRYMHPSACFVTLGTCIEYTCTLLSSHHLVRYMLLKRLKMRNVLAVSLRPCDRHLGALQGMGRYPDSEVLKYTYV